MVNWYPIKQYVTGYMKVTWASILKEGLFSPGNLVHGDMFAQEHQYWRLQDWHIVLFTDENRFHLSACDRRVQSRDDPENDTSTATLSKQTDM